jgi:hypothetical protein
MAYIGKTPVIGNFVKLDAITAVNGQAAYTMQNGGSNFTDYESVNQFLVSLNGTIQAPTDSFTVSGSTLTFASNLATGDVIDFIMVFGNSLSAGTPTDGTVTSAKLATLTSAINFEGEPSNMRINFNNTGSASHATVLGGIMVKNNGDSVGQMTIRKDTSDTDGYINFETQSSGGSLTERVRIHSNGVVSAANGIALGVGTANTSSNVLDDYEEGTFTPTVNHGTISNANGFYRKIGNTVFFSLQAGNFSDSATNADILIQGLPFTSSSTSNNISHITLMTQQLDISGASTTGYLGAGATGFYPYANGNTSNNWDPVRYNEIDGSGTQIRASGFYLTD